ncbi:hypothetical protein ES702_03820 [subsurface metagenome]
MKETVQIPEGLNKKERDLYRTLMRSKEENIEKKWNYSSVKDIIGHKKTNSMNGEVKITFSYPLKEASKNEKSCLDMAVEELGKTKILLNQKIEKTQKELEDLKLKSDKIDGVLTALKEIKKDIYSTE